MRSHISQENDKNLLFRYVVMGRSRNILSKEVVVATPTEVAAQANTPGVLTETLPNTFSDMATASDKKIGRINIEVLNFVRLSVSRGSLSE